MADSLAAYVRSPSLRHLRDPHSIAKLANEIVEALDRPKSPWMKWDPQREMLLKAAIPCWVPLEDLQAFLNRLDGPSLTHTDVAQRLQSLEEEEPSSYAREELREGCLHIYEREPGAGTELTAIIGLLRNHVEAEEERLRSEQEARYRRLQEEDRVARENRLRSGANCGWTQLLGSPLWYARKNGRTYRLTPTKEKRWDLHRVQTLEGEEGGGSIGTYNGRSEASKVVAQAAYTAEPRW